MLAGPPPTATEVREAFEVVLADYAAGQSPPVIPCYGFDTATVIEALERVRAAAPDPPAELLDAARVAFESS